MYTSINLFTSEMQVSTLWYSDALYIHVNKLYRQLRKCFTLCRRKVLWWYNVLYTPTFLLIEIFKKLHNLNSSVRQIWSTNSRKKVTQLSRTFCLMHATIRKYEKNVQNKLSRKFSRFSWARIDMILVTTKRKCLKSVRNK